MRRPLSASNVVLLLLCLMYLITYVDRVNVGTAAAPIKQEFGLSNTELGLVFSAFAYPYLVFQIVGGWVGDRLGPRLTLFACGLIWGVATVLTGLSAGLVTLFLCRVLLGFGEGATFPTATRAMQHWIAPGRRGFAQGLTHSFARFGNAVTPPIVAWLTAMLTWRGSFVALGGVSLIWGCVWIWYFRDEPARHPAITPAELEQLPPPPHARDDVPWTALLKRLLPVALVYFCYGWTFWVYLNWLPSFFLNNYHLDIGRSAIFASGVFFAGVIGDALGGVLSDHILRRSGNVRLARLGVIVTGFLGAFLSLLPVVFIRDLTAVAICLSAGFFFAELIIGPMWSIPMDIAPKHSGTGAGIMNSGSALAAIVSPLATGAMIDLSGSFQMPLVVSLGLLMLGLALAFTMRPERRFEQPADTAPVLRPRTGIAGRSPAAP